MGRSRKAKGALSRTLTHGRWAILGRNLQTNEFDGFAGVAAMMRKRFGDAITECDSEPSLETVALALYNFRINNAFESIAGTKLSFSFSDFQYFRLLIKRAKEEVVGLIRNE